MNYVIDFLQFMSLFVPVFVTYGLYKLIDNKCGRTVRYKTFHYSFQSIEYESVFDPHSYYYFWQEHNFLRAVFFVVMLGISLEYYSFIFGVV